jgi:Na+-transporting NADH:ubiquinone oxidoreductase subunit NqrF
MTEAAARLQHNVTFQPRGRTLSVPHDTTILEAAAGVGLVIDTPCGGAGTCAKCRVQISPGAGNPTGADCRAFSEDELKNGWRLQCD